MNVRKMIMYALVTFAGFAANTPAHAACDDVLQNGTFQDVKYRQNDYFQQIIYSRFMRSTYESSKTDVSGGFGVPIGEAVMGKADYSQKEYNEKKSSLDRTYLNQITQSREIDVALASGDSVIVNAWKACMLQQGGPEIRFEAQSPTEVLATLEFFSAPNTSTTLANDVPLPAGSTVTSGGECLKAGTILQARIGCAATIVLPSASTTLFVAVNTNNGPATAYLPRRMNLMDERRTFPFAANCNLGKTPSADDLSRCEDRLWTYSHRNSRSPRHTVDLSPELIAEGWRFDPASARVTVEYIDRISPSGMSWCYQPYSNPGMTSFEYGYDTIARTSGHDQVSQLWCMVNPSIDIIRTRWVPQDDGA
jgi:hypothetical protein